MTENREQTPKSTIILIYLIGFCFLWEQCRRFSFPSSAEWLSWIRLSEFILLGAVLFRMPYRDHQWYFIMILSVLVILCASWHRSPTALEKTQSIFSKIILIFLLCPAIGILVQGRSLKRFLQILIAVWTITNVILSAAGIYAVSQGIEIVSYNGKRIIGLDAEHCLLLWDTHRSLAGMLLMLSIMAAYIGAAMAGKKWIAGLYLAGAFVMLIALAMTNSRATTISTWIGSGIALAAVLQKRIKGYVRKEWLRWVVSLLLVIAVMAVGLLGTNGLRHGVNAALQRGGAGALVSSANAETAAAETEAAEIAIPETSATEEEPAYIAERDYFSSYLSGREDIWQGALEALKKRPSLLITGTSIHYVMTDLNLLTPMPDVSHLHNQFLQTLVATGIFGLLLFIAFLVIAIWASIRLFRDLERPLWERLMILPFICVLPIIPVETLRINSQTDLIALVMFFTGVAIEISGVGKKGIRR
ncbi:MAG: O-antigen ligase family protein [Clostridia bacterium]|nr:O-antigen ligase family protein [Clostridia bacterium]